MTALLEVRGLSVEYTSSTAPPNHAVSDLDFSVQPGQVTGMVGESGSGKSTAVLAVLGLTRGRGRIVRGSVSLEGRELLGLPLREWQQVRGRDIGLVTQNPRAALNPVVPVGVQIATVYRLHTGCDERAARARALELLRLVGINDPARRYDAFAQELSGGMAQRVVIAIALSCSPKLLIADEPTSGLDVTVQAQILDDLAASVRAVGSGLLIVTRDLAIVANYCDRVYLLHAGEAVETAATSDALLRPAHPATLALLAAQRRAEVERFRLSGLSVDGRQLPDGCWVSRRCPFASAADGCMDIHPALERVGEGHAVRCHRWQTVRAAWDEALGHVA